LGTLLGAAGSLKAFGDYTVQLERQAMRDPLTDLYNHRAFWELLIFAISRAERQKCPASLIVIDFDSFKLINDSRGHASGDAFLRAAAKELTAAVPTTATVARYGGDEFAVCLYGFSAEATAQVADDILHAFRYFTLDTEGGSSLRATVSVGYSCYPHHGATAKQLFAAADREMYRAKSRGRNQVGAPGGADLGAKADEFAGETAELLRAAIDNHWIMPYFQPIFRVKNQRVVAHEVLMRIVRPSGILVAEDVIATAEATGLVHVIDEIIIAGAFRKSHEFEYLGDMYINVSPVALVNPEFTARVRALAERYEVMPRRVVFELTERQTVGNVQLLVAAIHALSAEGYRFAIDDFGTGFSSFQYLRRLPIDILKIDGEFVAGLKDPNGQDRAIIAAMSALSHGMSVETVAEFVEDAETLAVVTALGVDLVQGYFVGRPAPYFTAARPGQTGLHAVPAVQGHGQSGAYAKIAAGA
jgi:diguanylate cyclase (GGDEF)-like protein